jgi:hypothetical protein
MPFKLTVNVFHVRSTFKWKSVRQSVLEVLTKQGQGKKTLERFAGLSEHALQSFVFAKDVSGPYLR